MLINKLEIDVSDKVDYRFRLGKEGGRGILVSFITYNIKKEIIGK